MNDAEFLTLAEELVEAEPNTLTLDDDLDDIGWDSMSNIEFIATVDTRLRLSVDAERLNDCRSLRAVKQLIETQG